MFRPQLYYVRNCRYFSVITKRTIFKTTAGQITCWLKFFLKTECMYRLYIGYRLSPASSPHLIPLIHPCPLPPEPILFLTWPPFPSPPSGLSSWFLDPSWLFHSYSPSPHALCLFYQSFTGLAYLILFLSVAFSIGFPSAVLSSFGPLEQAAF